MAFPAVSAVLGGSPTIALPAADVQSFVDTGHAICEARWDYKTDSTEATERESSWFGAPCDGTVAVFEFLPSGIGLDSALPLTLGNLASLTIPGLGTAAPDSSTHTEARDLVNPASTHFDRRALGDGSVFPQIRRRFDSAPGNESQVTSALSRLLEVPT